jgi:hypothetical protein
MTQMKNIIITALAVALVGLAGCDQNRMTEYENSPGIYFYWDQQFDSQHDSINHSFFLRPSSLTHDTVWVEVMTMGYTADEDRPVSIVQTNAGKPDAAVAGTHYVAFDTPDLARRMVVPAGEVKGRIPVVVIKDESLDTKKVRLELAVADNGHFRPGIDRWRKFLVTTTSMTEKPNLWDKFWSHHFGPTWGIVKFRFIIEATGYLDWETAPADDGFTESMKTAVAQRFVEYNRDHYTDDPNDPYYPLKEANEDLVVFE